MRFNNLVFMLMACCGLLSSLSQPASAEQIENTAPKDWQVEVALLPFESDHNQDVINLVPKQSIMMQAFVWHPTTETWVVKYPDWDMPGASIEKMPTMVANIERQHEGALQYGHTQKYILTPVDIGVLQLTQRSMDVSPSHDGSAIVPLQQPISVQVDLPEGVYSIDRFLPAYGLDVQQSFHLYTNTAAPQQLELDAVAALTLKKGDMLERRIRIKAAGSIGNSIPAIVAADPEVDKQKQSQVRDLHGMFGFEGGERIDSFFYSPAQGGEIILEPIDIEWWHLADKTLNTVTLSGVSFDSVKVEAYEQAIGLKWWQKISDDVYLWAIMGLLGGAASIFCLIVLNSFLQRSIRRLKCAARIIQKSEQLAFAKLLLALSFAGKDTAVKYFTRWQYASGEQATPAVLSTYFYRDYQVVGIPLTTDRWQRIVACVSNRHARRSKSRKAPNYCLPQL